MGGRGSGRRICYIGKPVTGNSMPMDILKITRNGFLVPGNNLS